MGYRKIAKIHKSMQICMPFVQKNVLNNFLTNFFYEMTLPQTVYFPISNFWYKLNQPTVHILFNWICEGGIKIYLFIIIEIFVWRYRTHHSPEAGGNPLAEGQGELERVLVRVDGDHLQATVLPLGPLQHRQI